LKIRYSFINILKIATSDKRSVITQLQRVLYISAEISLYYLL